MPCEVSINVEFYNTLSDNELWALLNSADRRAALSVLYQRYYELLYNYGLKHCSDTELIKDTIQDIFVKLHQGKVLATQVSVRSYLLRAFHNAFLDQYEVKGKFSDTFLEECLQIPDTKNFFEDTFSLSDEDVEYTRILHEAIRSLSPNQKRILYLHYIRKLSHKEIAEVLNISVQSSMNLNNRTLNKLRAILPEKILALYLLWLIGLN